MRTDGTVTSPRLKAGYPSAMSEVNAELYDPPQRQQLLGCLTLVDVPAEACWTVRASAFTTHHNAVYCWARAQVNERYQTTTPRHPACEKGMSWRRPAAIRGVMPGWAISRVQDAPHCTVELI